MCSEYNDVEVCQKQWKLGSADVRDWQTAGALRRRRPRVADRGTPSRVDKRVAPDKEGAADKQCQGEGKL